MIKTPCYSPKKAWQYTDFEGNSKISFDVTKAPNGTKFINIPCGQCIGCRLDYSREWANRLMIEAKTAKNAYFVTLTYDDMHLPIQKNVNKKTGEYFESYPLVKEHVKKFIKDLRNKYAYEYQTQGIKYYIAGEYGDISGRPHYHMLLYNAPIKDLTFYKASPNGILKNSEMLQKLWGKGYVVIADLCWETAAYTARYVMKKIKGKGSKEHYNENGLEPEFILSSKGIGRDYYEINKEKIYKNDEIIIMGKGRQPQKIKPPRYYDKLYAEENPEKMEAIKERRMEIAERNQKKVLDNSSVKGDGWAKEKKYNEVLENNKKNSIKGLTKKI